MRGKAGMIKYSDVIHRITPAYAGKSFNARFTKNDPEDHPRLCGEKHFRRLLHDRLKGSPPPMRGKADFNC